MFLMVTLLGCGRVFSSRLNWDLRPNPLSALLAEKRRAGVHVWDLTESNPTRAGFKYPQEEVLAALADFALKEFPGWFADERGVRRIVMTPAKHVKLSQQFAIAT